MRRENWGYLIIWEFRVQLGKESRFEEDYGPDGAWVQFFRPGEGYLGSELVRDIRQPLRYVTLDFWTSRPAYERFRERHLAEYRAIDERCEQLTEAEVQVGEFERISGLE